MVDFLSIATVIDGENFSLGEMGKVAEKPLANRFRNFETCWGMIEKGRVGEAFGGLPDFLLTGGQEELFEFVIEDSDWEGVEEFVGDHEGATTGGEEGLFERLVPGAFVPALLSLGEVG